MNGTQQTLTEHLFPAQLTVWAQYYHSEVVADKYYQHSDSAGSSIQYLSVYVASTLVYEKN